MKKMVSESTIAIARSHLLCVNTPPLSGESKMSQQSLLPCTPAPQLHLFSGWRSSFQNTSPALTQENKPWWQPALHGHQRHPQHQLFLCCPPSVPNPSSASHASATLTYKPIPRTCPKTSFSLQSFLYCQSPLHNLEALATTQPLQFAHDYRQVHIVLQISTQHFILDYLLISIQLRVFLSPLLRPKQGSMYNLTKSNGNISPLFISTTQFFHLE